MWKHACQPEVRKDAGVLSGCGMTLAGEVVLGAHRVVDAREVQSGSRVRVQADTHRQRDALQGTRGRRNARHWQRGAKELSFLLILGLTALLFQPATAAEMDSWRFLNPHPDRYGSDMPPPQPAVERATLRGALAPASPLPLVRLGYVVPSNRSSQSNAVDKMRSLMVDNQNWFRDQFDRHGFGPKTFRFETEADGVTPKVHTVNVTETDAFLRADLWGRTITAAQSAGLSVWTTGEVWLLIPEAHLQAADGSITGGTALGASFGSGRDAGVAMLGSDALARLETPMFTDNRAYHNLVLPALGSFALKQDVSFPWFEGTTVSSVSSSARGASAHELSHAFGLPHDFRCDANFHGNLMGNGLRGFRGAFFPGRYATDYTRLSYAAALALNTSRYFNPEQTEATKPTLTIQTSGAVTITDGRITIAFSGSDASGLSAAWLARSGDLVAEMPLAGINVSTQFSTSYFTPGEANTYSITVFDRFGNRRSSDTVITPAAGPNRAPQPSIKIQSPVPLAGQTVMLDAGASTDPESGASLLKVEWDFDGDGQFDTAPTTTKTYNLPLPLAGNRYVTARISDPASASAVSTRIALHAHRPEVKIVPLGPAPPVTNVELSWQSKLGFTYQFQRAPDLAGWSSTGLTPVTGNGDVLRKVDAPPDGSAAHFYRSIITKALQ